MPLWSVQEWRARIGTSWCALGRPIRSKSSQYCSTGNYLGSPPPGGGGGEGRGGLGRRAESHADHGVVTVVIMISLLMGAILTLSHFILAGDCLIVGYWFVCTPVDLLLVQWTLAMSMVSSDISLFFSKSWSLLCCSDSTGSFLSGLEAFPSSANIHGQYCKITISCVYYYMEKCKRTDEQHACGIVLRNFWQNFCGKMRSIKLYLASAMIKASLLLRCGDVEMNPGPLGKLDQIIDWSDLGQVADAMYEWEGPIAEQLGLTRIDVAAIKANHPVTLELQRRSALERWKIKNGANATYRNLWDVFEHAGYRNLSDIVRAICPDISGRKESHENRQISYLNESHHVVLFKQLIKHSAKWREIGLYLGFRHGELDNIEARPILLQDAPTSWLSAMLAEWLQWAPRDMRGSTSFATVENLKIALKQAGLGATAHEFGIPNMKIDPALDLRSITNELGSVIDKWFQIGIQLGLSESKLCQIESNYHDVERCFLEVISFWLNGNTQVAVSWNSLIDVLESPFVNEKGLADKLREKSGLEDHDEDADHTLTDEISKQLFQEAMCEEGYVSLRTIVLLLIGVAGAGKTCFSHLLFNKDPPSVRESTPLAQASVRAVSLSRATAQFQEGDEGEVVWECVSPDELNYLIADVIKGIRDLLKANKSSALQPQPQSQASQRADTDSAIGGEYQEEQGADNQDASSVASSALPDHVGHSLTAASDDRQRDVEQLFEMKSVQDLISLISKSKGSGEISKQDWIYIIDSGGQPQFHDLLPTFVHHVSAAVFFVKLNETLNDCPKIKYYSKGGGLSGHPYLSTQNHLQIVQNCLQAMQSRSHDDDNKYCPDLFFVGTHRDEQHDKESLEMKNEHLQEILLDHALFRNHFVSQAEGHLLYQVNSKNPTDEDWKVVNNFRKAVMDTHTHEVKVPIRWFVLEQLLQQLSVDDVISFRQCLEVAGRLKMKKEHLKAALRYLAKLNIFEFFPHILPNVVFTSSQVLLNKVTELVEYSHLQNSPKLNVRSVDIHFRDYGELTIGMLKRKEFSRHYIPGLFEEDDLLRLWEKLLVVAKHDSNTFVMPAVLSALPQDKLSDHRLPMDTSSADIIMPLALYYQGGLFPSGIFSSLISYLQNKCGWMISMQHKKPKCLHRNCVTFSVTGDVETDVTLIYFHDWIELHIINLYNEDKQMSCHLLQEDLFNGLNHAQTVQKYDKLQPKRAFFCTCKVGSDLHLASITPTMLQCSLDTTRREKLTEKCKIWLQFSDAMVNELFSNAEGHSVQMEKTTSRKCKQLIGSFALVPQEEQGQMSTPPLLMRPRRSKQATCADMDVGHHSTEALMHKPELHELDLLKGKSKMVTIIDSVASKWDKLATRLYFGGEDIRRIQRSSQHQSDTACRNVFIDWLGGNGREPITWETLIEALKEAGLTELAKDARDILLSG